MKKIFSGFHFPLVVFSLVLAVIGLVNLYSATATFEVKEASSFFVAQVVYTVVGITAMFFVSLMPLRTIFVATPTLFVASVLLLALVLVMGTEIHGSLSWLDLNFVRLQPSEFGKIGLILILSRHLALLDRDEALGLRLLFKPTALFLIPTSLVVLQNDLGSSLFYGLLFGSLILAQGLKLRHVIIAIFIVLTLSLLSYHFLFKPYQKARVVSFMNPEKDPRGSGYHLVQSKIAVGSGGFLGKGYRKGRSHQLKFLPERHTDFVFPVLAEEWGFLGALLTLMFYLLFLFSGINIASRADTRFGFFLSVGIVALYFWHLVINLGGVLGLIPLTGVTLPFLSYGGSSLIANWLAIGFLLAVMRSRGVFEKTSI